MVELADLFAHCLDKQRRSPCLFFVHEEIGQLQRMAHQVVQVVGQAPLDVGLLLSDALLDVPEQNRASRVQRVLIDALVARQSAPVLCTEIDLLFDPSLAQDPFRLLLFCSRYAPLIVLWPGSFHDNVLAYAKQEHAHYRAWPRSEVQADCIQTIL